MDLCERSGEPSGSRHPWELSRLAFFERVATNEAPAATSILDIGAGDAWFLDRFVRRFPGARAVAWDINYTDEDLQTLGRLRSVELTREAPSTDADLVLLLDVIEHVDDDVALLRDALDRLTPAGRLVVSVPAWPRLFSAHDVHLGHRRRYTPASLDAAVAAAGGRSLLSGGLFNALLAPRALQVVLQRRSGGPPAPPADLGQWTGGPALTTAITAGLGAEGRAALWAARRGRRWAGLSTWCVAAAA